MTATSMVMIKALTMAAIMVVMMTLTMVMIKEKWIFNSPKKKNVKHTE